MALASARGVSVSAPNNAEKLVQNASTLINANFRIVLEMLARRAPFFCGCFVKLIRQPPVDRGG